jgi:hypothetical protein
MMSRKYKRESSSAERWSSVLSLAYKWQFETIMNFAFEAFVALPGIAAIDTVVMCETYCLNRSMAIDAYWALCSRGVPLSRKEGAMIGWEGCVLIAAMRDRSATLNQQNLKNLFAEFSTYGR